MKTLGTFELEYRKNRHVYVCRIGVRCCRTYLSCYRVYICGIFRIYLGYCRIYIVGVFAVYLYVGLSYTCLWYFPYIYIYLDYCRKAHTGIYICGIIRVYIFGLLPQTDTYLWYCHIHIGRASVDIFVILPQYLTHCRYIGCIVVYICFRRKSQIFTIQAFFFCYGKYQFN